MMAGECRGFAEEVIGVEDSDIGDFLGYLLLLAPGNEDVIASEQNGGRDRPPGCRSLGLGLRSQGCWSSRVSPAVIKNLRRERLPGVLSQPPVVVQHEGALVGQLNVGITDQPGGVAALIERCWDGGHVNEPHHLRLAVGGDADDTSAV